MQKDNNFEIRFAIKNSRICQYQIAEEIGISEFTFIRWLRNELPDDRKQLILNAINKLSTAC